MAAHESIVPFQPGPSDIVDDIHPKSPHRPSSPNTHLAVSSPLPMAWTRQALKVLESSCSRPSSPPRASEGPKARPNSAIGYGMYPGYISAPGEQYSQPPAVIMRSYGGFAEGQLQYQYGKLSPLTPTFAPSWVHDPPQRLNVNDLRLQPSQRAPSCYSPEFLTANTGYAVNPIGLVVNGRPASAAAGTQPLTGNTSPQRQHQPQRPASAAVLSPPGQHRALGRTHTMFTRHQQLQQGSSSQQPQQGYNGSASSVPARPHTGTSRHMPRPLTPQYLPSRGCSTRWGGKSPGMTSAATHTCQQSGQAQQGGIFDGIKKGLARSPLTDLVRSLARSTFDSQGRQQQTVLTRASTACQLSRNKSMRAAEGRMVLRSDTALRTTHYPKATEAQLRMAQTATHERTGSRN